MKHNAKYVSKETACASAKIINDVINENAAFRQALSQRVRESGRNLERKAVQVLNKMIILDGQKEEKELGLRGEKRRSEYKKPRTTQKAQLRSNSEATKKKKKPPTKYIFGG